MLNNVSKYITIIQQLTTKRGSRQTYDALVDSIINFFVNLKFLLNILRNKNCVIRFGLIIINIFLFFLDICLQFYSLKVSVLCHFVLQYILTHFEIVHTPLRNSFVTYKHHSSTELYVYKRYGLSSLRFCALHSDINRCVCVLYILPRTYCFENTFTKH